MFEENNDDSLIEDVEIEVAAEADEAAENMVCWHWQRWDSMPL